MDLPTLTLPTLPHPNLAFLNQPILSTLFSLYAVIYLIVTLILMYHWNSYGMKSQGVLVAESLFLTVSATLFTVAILAIRYF